MRNSPCRAAVATCMLFGYLIAPHAARADGVLPADCHMQNIKINPAPSAVTGTEDFAELVEIVRGTFGRPIRLPSWQVDSHSEVAVNLRVKNLEDSALNAITLSVMSFKGDTKVDYVLPSWHWSRCGDRLEGPVIDMLAVELKDKDFVRITITNGANAPMTYTLVRTDLGWHRQISDSVTFIQRLGVTKQDVASGIQNINFALSPGLTFGTVYTPRRDGDLGFLRFFSPGVGINVSFLDWKDQDVVLNTSDPTKPTFAAGTKNSDITTGVGGQISLFNGQISVLYGWNLQSGGPRRYWGIGLSFVNVYQQINSLVNPPAAPPKN